MLKLEAIQQDKSSFTFFFPKSTPLDVLTYRHYDNSSREQINNLSALSSGSRSSFTFESTVAFTHWHVTRALLLYRKYPTKNPNPLILNHHLPQFERSIAVRAKKVFFRPIRQVPIGKVRNRILGRG